ncbi:MAG: helix-turn-helix transcriptional regulator [Alphaproteobacteria bacterium]|nr:helix-turn-helix transcriptional regulator [Alphaproteobacteria bacterium]
MKKKKQPGYRPIPVEKSFAEWRKHPSYVKAYEALADEFAVAEALIDARAKANLRQEDVARRMKTSQTAVARLESGRSNPSLSTLRRYAKATGTELKVTFQSAKN